MQFDIRVGQDRRVERTAEVRTSFQQEHVKAITEREDFDYAFPNSGFEEGVDPDYTGPFFFGWFDVDGLCHGTRIGALRVLSEFTTEL